ncbi:MAG: ATP-binding protein, partial [Promethearchaeota archaeon]
MIIKTLQQDSTDRQEQINLLKRWYLKDENALPPEFILQPRKVGSKYVEWENWVLVERELRFILTQAINRISPTQFLEENRFKYFSSITEQELIEGCLKIPDAKEHVFAFFRTIEDLPQDQTAQKFLDYGPDGRPDPEAYERLKIMKSRVRKAIPGNVFEYQSKWLGQTKKPISTDHIPQFVNDVYKSLSKIILEEINKLEAVDDLDLEDQNHWLFAKERSKNFIGRERFLNAIREYIKSGSNSVFAIHGIGGSGKSTLMAKSAELIQKEFSDSIIILRFCGATPEASNIRSLLGNLYIRVSRILHREGIVPDNLEQLISKLNESLIEAKGNSIIIFIDSLDQLSKADNAHNLAWLPDKIPEYVHIIVSTRPSECLNALKQKIPQNHLLELDLLTLDEGGKLLNEWLKFSGRILTQHQREIILRGFKHSKLPLWLKLAFEEARLWKSYEEELPKLSNSVSGIIQDLFNRLSEEKNHGPVLLSRCLAYLTAAKYGLTEDEVVDVLSLDDEVWNDFMKDVYHDLPERQLPIIVWSRFFFDIEPYITERAADGTVVMAFFHREFVEVAKANFLSGGIKQKYHEKLALYFNSSKQPLRIKKADKQSLNLRRISELPFQQTFGAIQPNSNMKLALTDLEFIRAKLEAGMYTDLILDFSEALSDSQMNKIGGKTLEDFNQFIRSRGHVLRKEPSLTVQEALNLTDDVEPHKIAKQLLSDGQIFQGLAKIDSCFAWINKPRKLDPCLSTFTGHTQTVNAIAFSPDGKTIATGSWDKTIRLFDVTILKEKAILKGHTSRIEDLIFTQDGKNLISCSNDKTLRIWDPETGVTKSVLKGHTSKIITCVLSPNNKLVASICDGNDPTIRIWDIESGNEKMVLEGHSKEITKIAFSSDGKTLASTSHDNSFRIWDVETGKIKAIKEHDRYSYTLCAFLPDKKTIASTFYGKLTLWDAETYEIKKEITWKSNYKEKAFTPDGTGLLLYAASSIYRVPKILNTETGELRSNLEGHPLKIGLAAFSNNGKKLLTTTTTVNKKRESVPRLWDVKTGKLENVFLGHSEGVWSLDFSPDDKYIASGSRDGQTKLWDTETKVTERTQHSLEIEDLVFSPDGKILASTSLDETIRLWDIETGVQKAVLEGHGGKGFRHQDHIYTCSFSPNGKTLASASTDHTVKLWDIETGTQKGEINNYQKAVGTCMYLPDGITLVTLGVTRGFLRFWDISNENNAIELNAYKEIVASHYHDRVESLWTPDYKIIS